ncbi:hypothetical protein [Kingella negevensis]|uniref:hypothetical protein n=1 Tax=Kingella negevensis TaxID=1522312 RepID=UPI00254EBE12|nr:hypothetical protein [Kingella negevensis]MDK4679794.1 hypothetical protein [Kingella negevensis]MDK4682487.1 hypothetical protein [Kingella negevensis]MDK4690683.1 hypothetical protein [Kingella negevensis]MDK4694169.1 hypothetical protein [Kingella negevensis]MDK4699898.1 hypothetical protein [Kingella negevensis]
MKTWILLLALSFPIFAQAKAAEKTIFVCAFDNGKSVRVTERGDVYRYQYGKANQPELVFENNRAEAIKRSPRWQGIGRNLWINLTLKNGQYQYSLGWSMDRLTDEHEESYFLTVERNEQFVTQQTCRAKPKPIFNPPEELQL